jgi:hypothetical protein
VKDGEGSLPVDHWGANKLGNSPSPYTAMKMPSLLDYADSLPPAARQEYLQELREYAAWVRTRR